MIYYYGNFYGYILKNQQYLGLKHKFGYQSSKYDEILIVCKFSCINLCQFTVDLHAQICNNVHERNKHTSTKIMEVIDMKNMLKVVIRFITKDVIAPDFNPWLVQREVDVPKRFV